MAQTNILIADDHSIVRNGIRSLLEGERAFEIVAEARNGVEALEACDRHDVHLALMDIKMPKMNGIDATRRIRKNHPDIEILALTLMDEDEHIRKMIEAGASGYVLKSSDRDELIEAVTTVADGQHYFSEEGAHQIMMNLLKATGRETEEAIQVTEREREVLELMAQEYTNQQIAQELDIDIEKVDRHRRNLLDKTGSKNIAGLLTYAIRHNLVNP